MQKLCNESQVGPAVASCKNIFIHAGNYNPFIFHDVDRLSRISRIKLQWLLKAKIGNYDKS